MLSDSAARRVLYPLTAAIILAWFLFFTWKSLGLYFDSDDMMNLYFAWSKPLADVYRPVGALFYRGLFALAGFNPLPFRIACLAIGVANMGLCWWFVRLVSGSERVAAVALLLFAFHTRLMEVWWRNAVIYDLLCFTFFYLAVCLYISTRKAGRSPGWPRSCTILACFLCAPGGEGKCACFAAGLTELRTIVSRGALAQSSVAGGNGRRRHSLPLLQNTRRGRDRQHRGIRA